MSRLATTVIGLVLFVASPEPLLAGVTIGLNGSASSNNLGYERAQSNAISADINLDITDHLRTEFTHRRSYASGDGYKRLKSSTGDEFSVAFTSKTEMIINSINLIVSLYNGQVSPYVFGGIAKKDIYTYTDCAAVCSVAPYSAHPIVPNYGVGVGIFLSRAFTLRISQTWSPTPSVKIVDGEPEIDPVTNSYKSQIVNDSYTTIGINYRL